MCHQFHCGNHIVLFSKPYKAYGGITCGNANLGKQHLRQVCKEDISASICTHLLWLRVRTHTRRQTICNVMLREMSHSVIKVTDRICHCTLPREDQGVREVIPHIGPIPIIIPLKLFLDLPRDPVFPRRLSDSQSRAMNFTHLDS